MLTFVDSESDFRFDNDESLIKIITIVLINYWIIRNRQMKVT